MAKPRSKPEAQTDDAAELPTEEEQAARAEGAEAQNQAEADAEARREREATKAADRKSYPDDAEAPPPEVQRGGETAYARDRLIEEGNSLIGHPSHVVAGALHGDEREYLTTDEAEARVEEWLGTPVGEEGS